MSERPAETEYSALQALLKIRTESGEGSAAGEAANAATANASQSAHNNITNLLRLQQAQMAVYSPNQRLAAIRAAASLQSPNGGFVPAAALQNAAFANSFLASARDPSSLSVATAPISPALDLPRTPILTPLRPAPPNSTRGQVGEMAQPGNMEGDKGASTDSMVRKDEVEAALRSKPQRGRKRENLNAEERLELTRTRNREHAKSTRIRKKARYQELLDTEQKYHDLVNKEELESKRRDTILGFLEARAGMLRDDTTGTTTSVPSKDDKEELLENGKSSQEKRPLAENRAISFDHAEAPEAKSNEEENTSKAGLKTDNDCNVEKQLKDFLEDENSFGFEAALGGTHINGSNSMALFDENVAKRLEHIFGQEAFSYRVFHRIVGSIDGIAMNNDGTAFARVEHVATSSLKSDSPTSDAKDDEKTFLSSLVSFEYAKDSALLKAVAWSILKDSLGNLACDGSKSDSTTAKESLESQTVYPSVVSFDEAHRDKATRDTKTPDPTQSVQQESDNPGMSI